MVPGRDRGTPDLLSPEERRRASSFRRKEDRDCYVAAHTALRVLLAGELGVAPSSVVFARQTCPACGGPHGRPTVPGAAVHYSLSRTDGLAVVAVADSPVGVDVERLPDAAAARETARALHPRERSELAELTASEHPSAFARCWTRKEASLKGLGTGLTGELLAGRYVGTGPRPTPIKGWSLADVPVPAGYAAACAVRETPLTRPHREDR